MAVEFILTATGYNVSFSHQNFGSCHSSSIRYFASSQATCNQHFANYNFATPNLPVLALVPVYHILVQPTPSQQEEH
tara:strand:+ start:349 stop:579 length:231 start_codon:yes stop_codon:yes gene_type:complete